MITPLVFVCLSAVVYGGPWMGKPRPMAAPAVDTAQWDLHQRLVALEPSLLQLSLDVSRLARATTEECYLRTEETTSTLHSLGEDLDMLARRVRPAAPHCVDFKRLKKTQEYFEQVAEDVYQCTHGLSDVAASFEVEMTERMVAARAQVMDIKQAMRFCQKYRPEVDEECLHRLTEEGLQILAKLPERARMVVDKAQANGAVTHDRLGRCLADAMSSAHERYLAETEGMRECFQQWQSKGAWADGEE